MGKGEDIRGIKPHRHKVHMSVRRKEDDDEVNLGNAAIRHIDT
jgi:hypothetical protein